MNHHNIIHRWMNIVGCRLYKYFEWTLKCRHRILIDCHSFECNFAKTYFHFSTEIRLWAIRSERFSWYECNQMITYVQNAPINFMNMKIINQNLYTHVCVCVCIQFRFKPLNAKFILDYIKPITMCLLCIVSFILHSFANEFVVCIYI